MHAGQNGRGNELDNNIMTAAEKLMVVWWRWLVVKWEQLPGLLLEIGFFFQRCDHPLSRLILFFFEKKVASLLG